MGGLFSLVTNVARRQVEETVARAVRSVVLTLLAAVLLGIGLVFGAIAAHRWLEGLYGPIVAPLIVAGTFVVIAAIVLLASRSERAPPHLVSTPRTSAAAAGAPPTAASASDKQTALEASALAAGRELAQSLDGKQLALVALIAGFVSGRLLETRGPTKRQD